MQAFSVVGARLAAPARRKADYTACHSPPRDPIRQFPRPIDLVDNHDLNKAGGGMSRAEFNRKHQNGAWLV
jgi:hypothetical protein